MAISWYPGHMHKAGKELRKLMTSTDAVIEVLDARIPLASANPMLAEIAVGKECIGEAKALAEGTNLLADVKKELGI